ncbi:hypothetical protein TNCV_2049561 [Trichonephila clavipes]|nr:hypothetical protein TNCV_2049561 [Trichonephila clavipes]
MAARKRSAIENVYIPDDLSDSESNFSFDSDSDINFSDCSSSSDESDHDSINLQSVRQWCKIHTHEEYSSSFFSSSPFSWKSGNN